MKKRTFDELWNVVHTLFKKHGLDKKGWLFKVNNRLTTTFGLCDHYYRMIELNKYLAYNATDYHLEQLILHEMAHAISGEGHTPKFREVCKKIGCVTAFHNFRWNVEYCYPEGSKLRRRVTGCGIKDPSCPTHFTTI